MSLFPSIKKYVSEKNGTITVKRGWGSPKVIVENYEQTGQYLSELWRQSFFHIPTDHSVKHILVLGLGGGCSIRSICRRFKNAHLTIIEWDEEMVKIAKELKSFPKKCSYNILVGDAYEVVKTLNQKFDLILVDLFTGGVPEPRLATDECISSLARVLESDGYLILNLFKTVALVPQFEKYLSRHENWYYKYNTIALFRHFGQGKIGEPPPEGFVIPMQSLPYLVGGWEPDATNVEPVGKPGCVGMRWHYGPFWVEAYTTDQQPEIDHTAHSRIVIWQPITKKSRPVGWHRSWVQMNPQQHGFSDIGGNPEYWTDWTDHAKRHRKKWLKDERYEIVEVSLEEFSDAYHATKKLPSMRKDFIRLLMRRMKTHGADVHLFAARDILTKQIISGLAVCDLPDVSCSMHLIAYLHPKFEKTSVGVGLIDHWFAHCQKTGIRFPHFGLIWAPGDPRGWKGYSKFKKNFNLFLLKYPMPLFRFVKQKK